MLPLPERQTGEKWEPDKNHAVLEIVEHRVRKYLSIFSEIRMRHASG